MGAGYRPVTFRPPDAQAAATPTVTVGRTARRIPQPVTEAGCTTSTRKTRAQSRHDHAEVGSGNGVRSSPVQWGHERWWVGMAKSLPAQPESFNNRPLSDPKRQVMRAGHCPSAPMARATTSSDVSSAAVASRPISALALADSGIVSVGLKALELVSET